MDDAPAPRSPVDPDGLMEFSVVFTDRSLNHIQFCHEACSSWDARAFCKCSGQDMALSSW